MRSTWLRTAAALLLVTPPLAAQQSSGRAFQLGDWYKVTNLSAPTLSPDGSQAAFTVTTVIEKENRRHTEVWVQSLAGGPAVRMTSPGTESSNPRWSDDGKTLYFTSTRTGGRGSNWALHMDQPGEAFQPERMPASQQGMQPDDKSFTVFVEGNAGGFGGRGGGRGGAFPGTEQNAPDSARANDPFGMMLPRARPPYDAITKPADPARFDGREITEMNYKSNNGGFLPSPRSAPRTPVLRPAQLSIQRGGGARKPLTSTNYSHRNAALSPDGKWIAFVADASLRSDSAVNAERDSLGKLPPNQKREEAPRNETDIFLIPVAACEAQSADCKPRKIDYFGNESDLSWSPDGRQLAFVGRPGQFKKSHLLTVSADGGKPQDLLGNWMYEPGNIEWMKDGSIVMITSMGGSSVVSKVDPATKKMTPVLGGRRRLIGPQFDKAQSKIVFTATDMTHPTELFVANADGSGERKLTSFNDKLNAEVAWADAERFTYTSVGGLEIEGWLMKPFGYQAGRKYPLVLYIHGGPHSQYNEGWFDEFQNLAGAGMMVLFTNPRGSSGTNAEFQYTRGRWGAEDYVDLMKAVDIAAKRPDVDSTRMGVTGGSYGGYMTAWVTTKTNRFKAAETDRMISEWTYWWGASDVQGLTEGEFFGKPWENQAMYDSLSPIRHVQNVKTPTLLVQSEEDYRTPMGNAETWFMALKKLGVPAEFVRYPRSTHELSRSGEPWLLVDRLGRLRQWFGYWLSEDRPKAATSSGR